MNVKGVLSLLMKIMSGLKRFLHVVINVFLSLPGSELHPAASGGTEPLPPKSDCKTTCAAVLEESGGDTPDRLPC